MFEVRDLAKIIYLDNAATTRTDELVVKEMLPYFSEKYGNPGSFHSLGLDAKEAVAKAREKIGKLINAKSEEIYFTGSGTESINLALFGIARANSEKGKHIITSNVEHHAVLEVFKQLEKHGFEITILNVDKFGMVSSADVEKAIRSDTILVSIMFINNEIGTINSIAQIGKICRKKGVYFHTDACQAGAYEKIDVDFLNVDLLSLNGSKIYGPKGIGMLFVRKDVKIEPIIFGGGQEKGLRSGTENVPGIVGFAKALEICSLNREEERKRLTLLRDKLISGLLKIPKTRLNGHSTLRAVNNISISFLDIEGESVLLHLNELGVCASTGSACNSVSLEPSHVITGLGVPYEVAHGTIRFTLGRYNTLQEVEKVLKIMPKIVTKLRALSPINVKLENDSGRP